MVWSPFRAGTIAFLAIICSFALFFAALALPTMEKTHRRHGIFDGTRGDEPEWFKVGRSEGKGIIVKGNPMTFQ